MFFDQVCFKDKGFNLVVDDNKFEICDHPHKLSRFRIMIPARLEIRTHAITQVFGLPHVDDLARRILMDINAGVCGQELQLLGDRHDTILACRLGNSSLGQVLRS